MRPGGEALPSQPQRQCCSDPPGPSISLAAGSAEGFPAIEKCVQEGASNAGSAGVLKKAPDAAPDSVAGGSASHVSGAPAGVAGASGALETPDDAVVEQVLDVRDAPGAPGHSTPLAKGRLHTFAQQERPAQTETPVVVHPTPPNVQKPQVSLLLPVGFAGPAGLREDGGKGDCGNAGNRGDRSGRGADSHRERPCDDCDGVRGGKSRVEDPSNASRMSCASTATDAPSEAAGDKGDEASGIPNSPGVVPAAEPSRRRLPPCAREQTQRDRHAMIAVLSSLLASFRESWSAGNRREARQSAAFCKLLAKVEFCSMSPVEARAEAFPLLLAACRSPAVYSRAAAKIVSRAGEPLVGREASLLEALLVKIKACLSIHAVDAEGATALHHACRWGNAPAISSLLAAGASMRSRDESRSTPLHWMFGFGCKSEGENAEAGDDDRRLRPASGQGVGSLELQVLVGEALEADSRALLRRNREGNTPLHVAVKSGAVWAVLACCSWISKIADSSDGAKAGGAQVLPGSCMAVSSPLSAGPSEFLLIESPICSVPQVQVIPATAEAAVEREKRAGGDTPVYPELDSGKLEVSSASLLSPGAGALGDKGRAGVLLASPQTAPALSPPMASPPATGSVFAPLCRNARASAAGAAYALDGGEGEGEEGEGEEGEEAQPERGESMAKISVHHRVSQRLAQRSVQAALQRWEAPLDLAGFASSGDRSRVCPRQLSIRNAEGLSPVHLAVFPGAEASLPPLLRACGGALPLSRRGWTPLHQACFLGNEKALQRLIEHCTARGARLGINQPTAGEKRKTYPLHLACRGGSLECARALLAAGAQVHVNTRDYMFWTPLHYAAEKGALGVAECLLDEGADPNVADDEGLTPALKAAELGNLEMLRLLVGRGASLGSLLRVRDRGTFSCWQFAAQNGHLEVLQYLCSSEVASSTSTAGVDVPGQLPGLRALALRRGHQGVAEWLKSRISAGGGAGDGAIVEAGG